MKKTSTTTNITTLYDSYESIFDKELLAMSKSLVAEVKNYNSDEPTRKININENLLKTLNLLTVEGVALDYFDKLAIELTESEKARIAEIKTEKTALDTKIQAAVTYNASYSEYVAQKNELNVELSKLEKVVQDINDKKRKAKKHFAQTAKVKKLLITETYSDYKSMVETGDVQAWKKSINDLIYAEEFTDMLLLHLETKHKNLFSDVKVSSMKNVTKTTLGKLSRRKPVSEKSYANSLIDGLIQVAILSGLVTTDRLKSTINMLVKSGAIEKAKKSEPKTKTDKKDETTI